MRRIVERIADEDCFDCVFTPRDNHRFMPRERCVTNNASKKSNRLSRQLPAEPECLSSNSFERDGSETTVGETEGETECGGEAGKSGINSYYCNHFNHRNCYLRDHLQQCLLFWQEQLPQAKKLFKA